MKYLVIAMLAFVGCSQKPTLEGCVKKVKEHYKLSDDKQINFEVTMLCQRANNSSDDVIAFIESVLK